jgi:hypothetical protein
MSLCLSSSPRRSMPPYIHKTPRSPRPPLARKQNDRKRQNNHETNSRQPEKEGKERGRRGEGEGKERGRRGEGDGKERGRRWEGEGKESGRRGEGEWKARGRRGEREGKERGNKEGKHHRQSTRRHHLRHLPLPRSYIRSSSGPPVLPPSCRPFHVPSKPSARTGRRMTYSGQIACRCWVLAMILPSSVSCRKLADKANSCALSNA